MPAQPINQRYNASVTLDGNGNGSVDITMRADFVLQNTRWVVTGGTGTNQVTASNLIDAQPWDGTDSGDNDQSGKTRLLGAQTVVTCQWTGGRPGGRATLYLWGVEYPAGQGIPPPSSGQGPGNPIVGGQTLIRDSIQSSNFHAGTSGWAIFRNGSYEFGSGGTFRGNLEVDGTDGSKVSISAQTGTAAIGMQPPNFVNNPGVTAATGFIGATNFDQPGTAYSELQIISPKPNGAEAAEIDLISEKADLSQGSSIQLTASEIDLNAATGQTDLFVNGNLVDPLLGNWIAGGTVNATQGNVTSSAEVTQITAVDKLFNAVTYQAGRLYRVVVIGSCMTTAVAASPLFRARKNGGVVLKAFRVPVPVVNTTFGFHFECIFQVPANVNTGLILTLAGATSQTVNLVAAADNAAQFDVYDAGPASNFSSAYLNNIPSLT